MMRLNNGAKVHAAYILPASDDGMTLPHGIVFAENDRNWIVWDVHWDGEIWISDLAAQDEPDTHELWQCTNGHYFQKTYGADPKRLAQMCFGRKLLRLLRQPMVDGMELLPA